jgi:mannose-6-phosphate isomerase-like protein (cupin superfamily)
LTWVWVPYACPAKTPEERTAFSSLAPGIGVPRHTHTREDETYYVTSGELEVIVGEQTFFLKAGDSLMAPRDIPHQLRNSGNTTHHYLLVFSPSGFEEFVMATAIPAPDNAVAPTKRQLQNDDPSDFCSECPQTRHRVRNSLCMIEYPARRTQRQFRYQSRDADDHRLPCGRLFDVTMLVMSGGRERTQRKYRELFAAAGLCATSVVPTRTPILSEHCEMRRKPCNHRISKLPPPVDWHLRVPEA